MKNWWKYLCVLLLAYALYAGLTTPVGPGVASTTPQKIEIDPTQIASFSITATGYNTHFTNGTQKVWLKKDSFYVCGTATAADDRTLNMQFSMQASLPEQYNGSAFTLVIENPHDGLFLMPMQVTLKTNTDSLLQVQQSCTGPSGLKKASYFSFPYRNILYETIRNLNYHVPMWFTMIALLLASFIFSIMYLNKLNPLFDLRASQLADAGLLFGLCGIATGAFWARFTWGVFWSPDPKLNGAAIGVLIYLAYNILRSTIKDPSKTGRLSAVYNIMAFPVFIVLIIILPKVADFSLHPGSGDSVGFKDYDLDNNLRMVFYPAVAGWVLLGFWIAQLRYRMKKIEYELENE